MRVSAAHTSPYPNGSTRFKFEDVLPRVHYQFIVLSVAGATGGAFEWQDHVQHALAAGLPQSLVDGIAGVSNASLPHPFDLLRKILAKTLAWQPIPDALQVQVVAEWGKDGLVSRSSWSRASTKCLRRSIRASTSSRRGSLQRH